MKKTTIRNLKDDMREKMKRFKEYRFSYRAAGQQKIFKEIDERPTILATARMLAGQFGYCKVIGDGCTWLYRRLSTGKVELEQFEARYILPNW